MAIQIGPCRIADADGTHEPGDVLKHPTPALIKLAADHVCDPETGLPYAVDLDAPRPAPAPALVLDAAVPTAAPAADTSSMEAANS